jgi:hypothetical protein
MTPSSSPTGFPITGAPLRLRDASSDGTPQGPSRPRGGTKPGEAKPPTGRCADVLLREAEAALHALRDTMRQALTLSATSETNHTEEKARLLSYHVLPMHLQVGDRITDETGEWEVASQPYSKIGDKSVRASVRRVDQPATVEDRTWVAHERIRVKSPSQEHRTSAREVFQSEAI